MEPAQQGALVGGAIAIVGSAIAVYSGHLALRRRRNRDGLRDGTGDFLAACDQLWRAECAVRVAVFTMTYVDIGDSAGRNARALAEDDRLLAFEDRGEASWKAGRARATIALLAPGLAGDADSFYAACGIAHGVASDGPLPTQQEAERHQFARDTFLRSTRASVR